VTDVGAFQEFGNMNTEQVMDYHLRHNHVPAVTCPKIKKACILVVEKVREGLWIDDDTGEVLDDETNWDEEVTWTEGENIVGLTNKQTGGVGTIGEIYESFHLQDFC